MQVLQCASVLGRTFKLAHLQKLLRDVKVRSPLFDALEAADIVFASRRGTDAAYIFNPDSPDDDRFRRTAAHDKVYFTEG